MNKQRKADLFVDEILRALKVSAHDKISIRHPMAMGEISGAADVQELAITTSGVFSELVAKYRWDESNISAREWHGHFHGRQIRGVTVGRRVGTSLQLDIFLGSFPLELRQSLHEVSKGFVDEAMWQLPAGVSDTIPLVPVGEVLDARLPFSLASDIILTSPVACKPIAGISEVERVCGHSIMVYGGRASGPRLTEGNTTLSLWNGEVAGHPLEVANVIHWADDQHVKVMAMAMRPWPVVALFQARMQARTRSFLDESYFE